VTGYPLAFIRSNSIDKRKMIEAKTKSGPMTFSHEEDHDLVYVLNMKKGEMIVFDGCSVVHGSPRLVKDGGSRESLVVTFGLKVDKI
jgi:hypothetical protein